MANVIASRAGYPRQVQTFLDGLEEHVEDVSREFEAIVEINGKLYYVEAREVQGEKNVQHLIEENEMTDYRK